MNILFQYFTGGGGALSNVILLLQAIARKYTNDHICIICSENSGLSSLGYLPNIEIKHYGMGWHQEVDRFFLGTLGLRRIAKKKKADIVWSLNLGSYVKLNVPHILSINNPHQVYPWEVTKYHPDSCFNVAALRFFFRQSLKVSDGILVQTPIMGEYVRRFQYAPETIEVVPKAVENSDDVKFKPLSNEILKKFDSGLDSQTFTFLYVSTYTPHKNHSTLIDTFYFLASKGVNVRVALTVGDDELIEIGGEKAKSLIETGHIIPLGWTDKCYLKALYDTCNACLMPSVLESLSSAHLEAMQWGKPQITSDLPYSRDLCGDAAVYVAAENPQAWAITIEEFVNDPALREKLVLSGYERMSQFPKTWEEVATRVHDIFEEIIKK